MKIRRNILLQGLEGALNKQIVLKRYGKITTISAYPDMSKVVKTGKQKNENRKFREAVDYARSQKKDPESWAEYKARAKGLQKPHNVAIADFYHPPQIDKLDVSGFHGQKNDIILIEATDDFKVVKVTIDITSPANVLTETGEAEQKSTWKWEYLLHETYVSAKGCKITAHAWDKPGNEATREIIMV